MLGQQAREDLLAAKRELERMPEEGASSLAILRATLDASADAILVTDGSERVQEFNARFLEMWPVSVEVLAAGEHHRFAEATSERFADPDVYLERIEEIYTSSPHETQDFLETLDGRSIERVSRMQVVDGQNVGRVWIFHDATQRRQFERALVEDARILELLNRTGMTISSELDLPTLLQAVTDSATRLSGARFGAFFRTEVNERGEAFLLYTLSGAPLEAFERLGVPRNTPLFERTFRGQGVLRSADVTQEPLYGGMDPHRGMPAGHLPVRSYLAVPVVLRSGRVVGGLFFGHPEPGVFTERTERLIVGVAAQAAIAIDNARLYEDVRRLAVEREALLEAEREARAESQRINLLKDEFLANVSHELRTPLNAILGWSQVLATGKTSEEDLKQGLETIARNARAQAQLIGDLLDMSRIVSGKVRLDVQETDLAAVVQLAVNTVRPSAEARGIRLRQILDPLIGSVSGDPNRLQQVVWNLLSNAVKFTPRGGKVDVILQRVNSHLEITVTDSGIGIEPEFLPHVFERFRQGNPSTTRAHGGLGLGLAIVKQLVELHGGTVQVLSAGENRGATFSVSLPLAPVRADPERHHPLTPSSTVLDCEGVDLAGVRVLVVDDEPDARELIKQVLAHCNAQVLTAGSAAEALELLARSEVDVLVSDIGMPGTDGYEFIRRVRRLPAAQGGKTPAIALTAFARSDDRTKAMLAGYQMHIAKPIEPQELVATVASFAGRTQKAEQAREQAKE